MRHSGTQQISFLLNHFNKLKLTLAMSCLEQRKGQNFCFVDDKLFRPIIGDLIKKMYIRIYIL
jgi:hypothetical protein